MEPDVAARIAASLSLIAETPGYEPVAAQLQALWQQGRVRYVPNLPDRGQASLTGDILIGPEAFYDTPVALAATLIHENFHRHQFPLLKTASFWSGVATRTPVMRRYEAPAYAAAVAFLQTVAASFPELTDVAQQEADATRASFAHFYGGPL